MNETITNYDLFEEFFNFARNHDIKETINEYGGSSFYIPSYKTIFRDEEIIKEFLLRTPEVGLVKTLARKFALGERQIYAITKECRSLFQ
jgi:Mor family transcriptional regulator